MAKDKLVYQCSECGFLSPKWQGRCPECGGWNTFQEEVKRKNETAPKMDITDIKVMKFSDIIVTDEYRYKTTNIEFDRVLGGGLVKGEVVLLTGNPGIGKSTLLLQMIKEYEKYGKVLYVSGEESAEQIKYRGNRLKISAGNTFLMAETNLNSITAWILKEKPSVVVIDSIQTLYSSEDDGIPGTVSQIRECTQEIIKAAKENNISFFLVGHITKDGKIAGPKLLEHMVDAVLSFEGEEDTSYRLLRSQKNRFGSTNEIGVFSMDDDGIKGVTNPSEYFLGEREEKNIGSIIVPVIEGTRVFLLEIQALATAAVFGMPRRVVKGVDYNKLQIITAVLEKKLGLNLSVQDVFLNVPGGIKIEEPSGDLGMALAIISTVKSFPLSKNVGAIGELGLMGEIRKVSFVNKRLKELEKVGFAKVFVPEGNRKEVEKENYKIKINYVKNLSELIERMS